MISILGIQWKLMMISLSFVIDSSVQILYNICYLVKFYIFYFLKNLNQE